MARMKKKSRKRPGMGRFLGGIQTEIDRCVGSKPECIVEVLDAASEAAGETAEHLRSNWQDHRSGKAWDRIARIIDGCASKVKRELPF